MRFSTLLFMTIVIIGALVTVSVADEFQASEGSAVVDAGSSSSYKQDPGGELKSASPKGQYSAILTTEGDAFNPGDPSSGEAKTSSSSGQGSVSVTADSGNVKSFVPGGGENK